MKLAYCEGTLLRSPASATTLPEKLICGYVGLIPILWVVGLKLPATFLVVFGTLVLFVKSRFAWTLAIPWFAVGSMQVLSVLVNWYASGEPWWMIGQHILASYVSGWFMLGACLAIGASGLIRPGSLARSVRRLTVWSGILVCMAYLLAVVLPWPSLYISSPTAYLVPSSLPSREFSFGMFIYNWDELFRLSLPRVSLFYPWPNVLGVAGVCTVFMFWGDETLPRSKCAIGIGLLLVLASLGRLEIFALVVCLAFRLFLDCEWRIQGASVAAAASLFIVGCLWFGGPNQILTGSDAFVTSGRPGASQARQAVYDASWAGIRESPMLGHGWPGALLTWDDSLSVYGTQSGAPVGTHSTISGLLYKGGLLTFTTFCIAFVLSAVTILPYVGRSPKARNAITIWLALALTCIGEGFESLVLPICFVLIWLGSVALSLRTARRGL
jgi:hypothetical protein